MSSAGWLALARLQATRCARWPLLALLAVVAWLARGAFDRSGAPFAGAEVSPLEADMLARHGAWWLLLVALLPTFAWLAAGATHAALGRERPLLLAAGANPLLVLGATALGVAAAGALALALAATGLESGARVEGLVARSLGEAPAPGGRWIDAQGFEFVLVDPRPDGAEALILPLGLGGGAGAATLVGWEARTPGGATRGAAPIALQGEAVLALPPGAPLSIALRTLEPEARVHLLDGASWQAAPAAGRLASLELWWRALAALLALCGLAVGAAAWMRPLLAGATTLASWWAVAFWFEPAWLAGGDLGACLATVREGRIPPQGDAWQLADGVMLGAAGVVLGAWRMLGPARAAVRQAGRAEGDA
jgi:hypothetical protein